MKTVCLCMILKNEGHIIERCLESVKNIVDTYVICDTGSTDDTKEKITKFFDNCGINGVIYDHKWVNFGVNRNMLLEVSKFKADYLLLVDADYVINVYDENFKFNLDKTAYLLKWEGNMDYKNAKLIKGDLEWKYFGPTHEYIKCMDNDDIAVYTNAISITEHYDGGCRDNKFRRDIDLLLNEVNTNPSDPDTPRYFFYLARSYEDLQDYENSLIYYNKRVECGGFNEEVYYSKYKSGLCKIRLNKPFEDITETLLDAYNYRPCRLEALYHLILFLDEKKMYNMGYLVGKNALQTPYPINDLLFIDKPIHDYLFKLYLGLATFYVQKYNDALIIFMDLLNKDMPIDMKHRVLLNILHCLASPIGIPYDANYICNALMETYKANPNIEKYMKEILVFCRDNRIYNICYIFGHKLLNEQHDDYYVWRIKDEIAIAAYYIGKYTESINMCNDILSYDIDNGDRDRILKNIEFSQTKLYTQHISID